MSTSESMHRPCSSTSIAPAHPHRLTRRRSWPRTRECSRHLARGRMTSCTTTHSTLPRFGVPSASQHPWCIPSTFHPRGQSSTPCGTRCERSIHRSSPPFPRRRLTRGDNSLRSTRSSGLESPLSGSRGLRHLDREESSPVASVRRKAPSMPSRSRVERVSHSTCMAMAMTTATLGAWSLPRTDSRVCGFIPPRRGRRSGGSSVPPRRCSALRTGTSRSVSLPLRRSRAAPRWSRTGAAGSRTSLSTASQASLSSPEISMLLPRHSAASVQLDRTACRRHAEAHLDLAAVLDAHEHVYRGVVSSTLAAPHG